MNVVDQEDMDPPEYTPILIWDLELIIPSNDLFEVQEPLIEVSVVKTRSKGQLVSNDLTTTQNLSRNSTLHHPKTPFSPRRNPINIHT
jgi:hypothetical protein